jgi:hypothetical protein
VLYQKETRDDREDEVVEWWTNATLSRQNSRILSQDARKQSGLFPRLQSLSSSLLMILISPYPGVSFFFTGVCENLDEQVSHSKI